MSFGGGYVGNSNDALKIRKYEDKRKKESEEAASETERKLADAARSRIVNFATGKTDVVENAFKAESVGLQTKEQFTEKKNNIEKELEEEARLRKKAAEAAELRDKDKKRKKQKKELGAKLSFAEDEEEGEENEEEDFQPPPKKKSGKFGTVGKDPGVKTHFLPDRDREVREQDEREKLKVVFVAEQEKMKQEKLEITFSYWDGGGHRRKVEVLKGDSISIFLGKVRDMLAKDFRELRHAPTEGLMYVKEDLILPHTATFYDFIVNKVKGKSGPLFHFDVHEDVRLRGGANVEKDESHAGKVIHRSWYDKNKHIFPASRWETWDPAKDFGIDGYTIYGGEKGPDKK
eukprot:CAMPEP_0197584382 /NCGR_PEP_ID=MMETSP1326-20131121/7020_1 /TAXON_ID=1155430 /ORGANISM="Genus nov. species nov., Strain RCC2288" /LENGTH=345 /DNA_ID=CAMNT_0043148743 /DNA_START=247 /DNA_END=1284 /DNA_ORIENTATION=-